MASSGFPGAFQLPSCWAAQPQAWGWPRGERPASSSSGSPAPSPDSCSSCSPSSRAWPGAALGGQRGSRARRGPGQQRQSASQREKLRMRRLAQALHMLRRYLPASAAPASQSLTKIETLRLAIRYIGHLSELLGLGQEAPARSRAAPARPHCTRGPLGLGCGQSGSPPAPYPDAWPPGPSSSCSPDAAGSLSFSGCPCCPEPPLASPPGPEAPAWLPTAAAATTTCCSDAPPPGEDARPARSAACRTRAEAMPAELPGRTTGLSAQSLPMELLAFLEGFLPPASYDATIL